MNYLYKFITNRDLFAHDPSKELHYDGEHGHKRFFGGVCSCIMYIIFSGLIIVSAYPIVTNLYPYESSFNIPITKAYEIKLAATKSYKLFVELTDYVKSYNYTDVERKMIDMYINHFNVKVDMEGRE
jgi:hypothetical protein